MLQIIQRSQVWLFKHLEILMLMVQEQHGNIWILGLLKTQVDL